MLARPEVHVDAVAHGRELVAVRVVGGLLPQSVET